MANLYTKVKAGIALATICGAMTVPALAAEQAADKAAYRPQHTLSDGELFTKETVVQDGHIIFDQSKLFTDWSWHSTTGYPLGMGFAVIVNGKAKELPATAELTPIGGVPTKAEMLHNAVQKYSVQQYAKRVVLYATTGPSAAQTEIELVKGELFGSLLNVTVALRDAEPNKPLTMNLIYPEATQEIALSALPKHGHLRVRFVDMQGTTLALEDVNLDK